MWRCLKCGQQIDDNFGACWKCGTGRDGTSASAFNDPPDAADVHEREANPDQPDEPDEPADDLVLEEEDTGQRIVELCSAANMVEANCLCEQLEEAGIEARVVGDFLASAAGGLPLGEAISPRIWVHQRDQARAREVIAQLHNEPGETADQWPADEGTPPWETPAEPEAAEGETATDSRLRFLSEGFWIAAMLCVLAGGYWAWRNSTILAKYSAAAEGRPVAGSEWGIPVSQPGPDGLPREGPSYAMRRGARYAYHADGTTHYIEWSGWDRPPDRLSICYDPDNPARHIIGLPTPPRTILLSAVAIAALLGFIGYRFR